MLRRFAIIIWIGIATACALGCSGTAAVPSSAPETQLDEKPQPSAAGVIVLTETAEADANQEEQATQTAAPEQTAEQAEPETVPTAAPNVYSLTTGRLLAEAGAQHSPVLAVIANEPQVRPQMGLMQADVIYEFALDRGMQTTRLVAVYSDQYPALAGPITDARFYFFDLQREWNAMMVYNGYPSEEGYPAFDDDVIDIQAAYGPNLRYLFRRDTTVDSDPQNTLFCRMSEMANALYGSTGPSNRERFRFETGVEYQNAKRFSAVGLPFVTKDTKGIEFRYDPDDNLLYRYERNSKGALVQSRTLTPSEDGMTLQSEPVAVQNLIVQYVKYTPISDVYFSAELHGNGECDYFINGVYTPGFWRRDTVDGVTSYFLRDGSPLTLQTGTTWIAISSMQRDVRIQYRR